ncbi:type I restriction modification DNA specificity domain protein [Marvinbryantia formatexigens DSM 14469]|uniref:Type I restriction modification DNA specificity domain protein n=1 Tax=Marvinbryantia formatexigens DSM 14469 TaxID=478749 RepID=C6LMG1_9FIRM|nr:restriction endonuclease subunit S [Marvinbryantia formatexigens]EET58187.1 type I restriction modification DNA specificity domain protein [Marvinbryantia formatexigens DSM 14469]UWO26776.1 restriction endonuclease subunit S [Marvinbryantia formatexigens DSM 14469]SDH34628.1 type I restriction enzyme, S subunit [Marvinbryantia formatexigens]
MVKLIEITGKAISGEWGTDDETGDGIPVLRTTNFTNEGVINYSDIVTRTITKKNIDEKFLRKGDIIIEKSGGSDKFPVGRVIYFDGEDNTYLFNNFTGLLRVKNQEVWYPRYVFYSLFANYQRGGTKSFENKTTGLHNLKTDDYVSKYEVAEIDKKEQILICERLDKLYGIIKLREHELQFLDNLIKARFIEMFGDSRINSKGFRTKKGSELFKISNGKAVANDKRFEDGIPAYGGNGISWYTDEVLYEQDTIVIGRVGFQSGNVHLVKGPVWITDNAMYISDFYDDSLCLVFLCEMMKQIDFTRLQDAGDLKKVTQKPFMKMDYILPSKQLQDEYVDFVKQVDKSKVMVMDICHYYVKPR